MQYSRTCSNAQKEKKDMAAGYNLAKPFLGILNSLPPNRKISNTSFPLNYDRFYKLLLLLSMIPEAHMKFMLVGQAGKVIYW